jgi:hypothetical protein
MKPLKNRRGFYKKLKEESKKMNKTTWKLEAVVLAVVVSMKPTADSADILKSVKEQYKNWHSDDFSEIIVSEIVTSAEEKNNILNLIEQTKNKTLVVDKKIGIRKVKFYKHILKDMYIVKNDSILLHMDSNNNILYFHKKWSDIFVKNYEKQDLEIKNYSWKQLVVFPDKKDLKKFYTFKKDFKYPIICWEVRYNDGTTKMFNFKNEQIGYAVPTPNYDASTFSGYDNGSPHDVWHSWRANAFKWLNKWFDNVASIGLPTNYQVSNIIKDTEMNFFYEIGHSGKKPTRFQTSNDGVFYTAQQLKEDMKDRDPIKLAILCSCEAMKRTDQGTLSYEFRKGETKDTITIGYIGMGNCSGWYDSLDWQNCMFLYMDRGFSIKNSFDIACSLYPSISDCVRFVGDKTCKIYKDSSEKNLIRFLSKFLRTDIQSILLNL